MLVNDTTTIIAENSPVATTYSGTDYLLGIQAGALKLFPSSVMPTSSGGSSVLDWINVKNVGAVGNGTTDDTAAINAAITTLGNAGGGVLYFPKGTYRTTSRVNVTVDNVRLVGDGMGISIIKRDALTGTASASDHAVYCSGSRNGVMDMTVCYSTQMNRNTYTNGHALVIAGGSNSQFARVEVYNGVINILVTGPSVDCSIQECYSHDSTADGISIFGGGTFNPKRIGIINNRVFNTGDDAISCDSPVVGANPLNEDIVILGNTIDLSGAAGIAVWGGKGVVISSNTIRDTYLAAIHTSAGGGYFGDVMDIKITGNFIRNAAVNNTPGLGVAGLAVAILFEKTEGSSTFNIDVSNNEILNCQGPYLTTSVAGSPATIVKIDSLTVRNNKFKGGNALRYVNKYDAGTIGLSFESCSNLKVEGNEIDSVLQDGIWVGTNCSGEVSINYNRINGANLGGAAGDTHANAVKVGSGILTFLGNVIIDPTGKLTNALLYAAALVSPIVPSTMNQLGGKAIATF